MNDNLSEIFKELALISDEIRRDYPDVRLATCRAILGGFAFEITPLTHQPTTHGTPEAKQSLLLRARNLALQVGQLRAQQKPGIKKGENDHEYL